MAQSAEEWSKVAIYEKVADNENAVPELRALSARKANWLRILARLQVTGLQARPNPSNSPTSIDREALLFSPRDWLQREQAFVGCGLPFGGRETCT